MARIARIEDPDRSAPAAAPARAGSEVRSAIPDFDFLIRAIRAHRGQKRSGPGGPFPSRSLHLQDLAGGRDADLASLAVGGVLAADLVGVQLPLAVEVLPGFLELHPRDGLARGRPHSFGDLV